MKKIERELKQLTLTMDFLKLFSTLCGDNISLEKSLSITLERLSVKVGNIYSQIWLFDFHSDCFILKADLSDSLIENVLEEKKLSLTSLFKTDPKAWILNSKTNNSILWRNSLDLTYSIPVELRDRLRSVLIVPFLKENEIMGTFLLYFEKDRTIETETIGSYLNCINQYFGDLISEKRILCSLQESEEGIRKVLENMPVLFMAVDSFFRIVSWNLECERVLGYTKKEVINKDEFIKEILFKKLNVLPFSEINSKIFNSDFKSWELEFFAKDGKTKTISLSNLSCESSSEKWFVGVDITPTKEIERELTGSLKELSDFQTALNAVSIVAFTDRTGTIIYVNQNFCNISGYSRDELLGQNHRIINSGYHSKEFFIDLWKTISKGKIWKGEIKNKAKDGRFYWVDTTISPILDEKGKPYQYLAIRNDITERKETEEKARHAENNLKAFQDRMSPHFLFNTLSIIHSYLQINPEMADSAILMLADNYRFLTDHATKQLIPFEVEWEFMQNYLLLLKLRFSDFLDIQVEKTGDFSKCQIPPLTIQPIVENSYLHGLRNKKGKGNISVNAFTNERKTYIVIRDDGVGLKSDQTHSRTLINISERLKFYFYESEVKIENHSQGGTLVSISFQNPKFK
ncbi:PAS domain S-box protein [Leptospira noguchii]|uniref:Histidine kinase n=1 Tax=Leptospira noguchii serovar Autumnalis str. ZUN142 TaxID=1085540 RepID=M6UNQ8_9LEPT|nr:PAS domain S-box protein [Leptospira noguchii]EKR72035.1 histidine kinase [Leptospira noguchii str. 2006001870]EMO42684.1 histidine kinase [Leptospira noguchii serovar Autumnalis str. ZUN142]EMS88741.1 histidine kinase [Leptospira noguchii str. Hook]UOG43416.1 PAS domain S-box protein [Leptospira noguchii]UOG50641.1 PAS domain S-box protein [Leptospira noguchii]